MNLLSKIANDLLTGKTNETHDLGRWSWLCSALGVTGAAIWNAIHGIAFDLVQVASAFGIVAGAHGAALFMKRDTEPSEK